MSQPFDAHPPMGYTDWHTLINASDSSTWQSYDRGFLAWAFDPTMESLYLPPLAAPTAANGFASPVPGVVYLSGMWLRTRRKISSISLIISGTSPPPGPVIPDQNYLGLYNSHGTLCAQTEQGAFDYYLTAPQLGEGNKDHPVPDTPYLITLPLTNPCEVNAGYYWVACLVNLVLGSPASQIFMPITFFGVSSPPWLSNLGLSPNMYAFSFNNVGGSFLSVLASQIDPTINGYPPGDSLLNSLNWYGPATYGFWAALS